MSKLSKPRLGRGLSSLISVGDDEPTPAGIGETSILPAEGLIGSAAADLPITQRIIALPVGDVRANPHQPRRDFAEGALQELAASLKLNGVIQPIVVRQISGGFELIAGERRLRAAKLAGLATVPAIVKEVDGMTQAQLALVENIQRENLNPVDRAQAYKVLLEQLGLSHQELAGRLGEDRSTISNHLRLLELAAPIREWLRAGRLTLGHAKVLAGVTDVLEQERLAKLAIDQELSVRNLEKLVAAAPPTSKKSASGYSNHIRDLEKSISRQIGMRVQVRSSAGGKGKLTIHYPSLDQFDELMAKLGVSTVEE